MRRSVQATTTPREVLGSLGGGGRRLDAATARLFPALQATHDTHDLRNARAAIESGAPRPKACALLPASSAESRLTVVDELTSRVRGIHDRIRSMGGAVTPLRRRRPAAGPGKPGIRARASGPDRLADAGFVGTGSARPAEVGDRHHLAVAQR